MKNIHLLPTDKPSRLHTYKGVLNFAAGEFVSPTIIKNDLINLNIYITSDEEIKDDWCYDEYNKVVFKNTCAGTPGASKKIILTTDQDLIKDGVQAINDKFLEWFVKNPSCEFVKIVDDVECLPMPNIHINKHIYKIIISKEELKQMSKQTAVEWVIEQYINKNRGLEVFTKAIQMEKEQMWDYIKKNYCIGHKSLEFHRLEFEKYYNEIYKKEEK
jgi:hypothetical protein